MYRIIKLILKRIFSKKIVNCDLSELNLNFLPVSFWDNCEIDNVDFTNSKININPKNIKNFKNVNFNNVDLSYLKPSDYTGVSFQNCSFIGTKLDSEFKDGFSSVRLLENVTLDRDMKVDREVNFDIKTIENSPSECFDSQQVLSELFLNIDFKNTLNFVPLFPLTFEERNEENIKKHFKISKKEYYHQIKLVIDQVIIKLKENNFIALSNLIIKMCEKMDLIDVLAFIKAEDCYNDILFKNMTFTKEDYEILKNWRIRRVKQEQKIVFDNCTFDISYDDIGEEFEGKVIPQLIDSYPKTLFNRSEFNNCSLANDTYANKRIKKVYHAPFTCNSSVYIKLGNNCNANCEFCKNKSEEITEPNLDKIIETLYDDNLYSHLNEIYFGGGEPTLYLKEIYKIMAKYDEIKETVDVELPDWYIFTNGTGDWKKLYQLIHKTKEYYEKAHIILSRHEIDDEKNSQIFGIQTNLENPYLRNIIYSNKVILALTCSDQNLRENFLEEYYEFGLKNNIQNFMIQSLESKTETNNIDVENCFKAFESYLKKLGFSESYIISTSYFDLKLYKSGSKTVALKRYFAPEELKEYFESCSKHSFDMGIDSNGDLYNDFQMIKKLKL